MRLSFLCFLLLFPLLALHGTSSLAASTGWIDAHELETFNQNTLKIGYMPVSIACKNAENVQGMSRKNTLVKIEYQPNPNKIAWRWAWGTSYGPYEKKNAKQNYKRVSYDSFRRKSGLLIRCAIWHKVK